MTLKELLETNCEIGEIQAEIRDAEHGYHLLQEYHVGSQVTEDRFAKDGREPRWICIRKPINLVEQSDKWGVILANIPKDLLNMEVAHWNVWHELHPYTGHQTLQALRIWLKGKDDAILVDSKDVCEQLDGQMSLTDYLT